MSEGKKCGFIGKLVKVGIVLCILLAVVVAALPLWIGPVVTGVANSVVPGYTGTDFNIESFSLNPWTGKLRVKGVKLANPEGYGEAPAFAVTSIAVDWNVGELFAKKLHITELSVDGPYASYFSHDGVNNFDKILENVKANTGGDKEEKEKLPEEEKEGGMKVMIDHLVVDGTRVKLAESALVPELPIMKVELNDLGKESDGCTWKEMKMTITDGFMKVVASSGDGLKALGGFLGGNAKELGGILGDGAKNAGGVIGDGVKNVGEGAKAVGGAIGDGAKSLTDGVKNLFK